MLKGSVKTVRSTSRIELVSKSPPDNRYIVVSWPSSRRGVPGHSIELLVPGNCILASSYSLGFHEQSLAMQDRREHPHPQYFESRGHRTYWQVAEGCDVRRQWLTAEIPKGSKHQELENTENTSGSGR